MIRERTHIITHDKEGILHVPDAPSLVMLKCSQRLMEIVDNKLVVYTRYSEIIDTIDKIIEYQQYDTIEGNIIVVEQYSPIDDDNPLEFLVWQEDGTVLRHGEKAIWRMVYYSSDPTEEDILVTNQYERV